MKNDLFTIGSITIHGYGLMIGIGILYLAVTHSMVTWQSTGQTSGGWTSI